jgi:hypothetical protein
VRCPLGHAVQNITVIDAMVAGTEEYKKNTECDDIYSFCVLHMPEVPESVQIGWANVSIDVACTPVSFLASSLLSTISREHDRWLWWWPLKEGDISTRASHIEYLSRAASLSTVKTVCELGFNQGFSAIMWLASNPSLRVYSFDLMRYSGSYAALEFVQNNFPGRLTLIRGDSKHSIADFASTHCDLTCDIIFVDGLHTFDGALTDMKSFSQLAHAQTVLLMDDLGSAKFNGVEQAWSHAITDGLIVESQRILAVEPVPLDWPSCNHWDTGNTELGVGRFTERALFDGIRARYARYPLDVLHDWHLLLASNS